MHHSVPYPTDLNLKPNITHPLPKIPLNDRMSVCKHGFLNLAIVVNEQMYTLQVW